MSDQPARRAPASPLPSSPSKQSSSSSSSFLSCEKLTRRFGTFVAVDHVSFDVPRGKVFGFLGPNGSGKSTTIRMLAGLLRPSEGHAKMQPEGRSLDVARDTDVWKTHLGYMSQKFSLYLDLTVEENLTFFGSIYGLPKERLAGRIRELSARLRFAKLLPSLTEGLSTGYRQRVALAAALLHEPELLFLDEPTGGVDPRGRRLFWDLIYELAADKGMTVLVTTHYMDEAEQCDRLAFILDGAIIAEGAPPDLKRDLADRIVQVTPPSDPFLALEEVQKDSALEDAYLFGTRLRAVAKPGAVDAARSLLSRFAPPEPAEPSLEDVFVSLARKQKRSGEEVAA
jgi:ABC-2 type transport system ATP-binding protein